MTQSAVDVQAILSDELMQAARGGWVLEDRGDSWATLRRGHPYSPLIHLLLTLLTFGFWIFVWIYVAIRENPRRIMIEVSSLGEVTVEPV